MLILTSPAKTLDFEKPYRAKFITQPQFLSEAEKVVTTLRTYSANNLKKLMKVSDAIADLNYTRFQKWVKKHDKGNARPAVVAYQGDIYKELHEVSYTESQQEYLQNSLRIISGLYGLLKPYDLIEPYRLEMGIPLQVGNKHTLYDFWSGVLNKALNDEITKQNAQYVINLASQEYVKAIQLEKLRVPAVNILFLQKKKGKMVNIGLLAKRARGMMIDYLVTHRVNDLKGVAQFKRDSYAVVQHDEKTITFLKSIQ